MVAPLCWLLALGQFAPRALPAQEPTGGLQKVDSLRVSGYKRNSGISVLAATGITEGSTVSWRDLDRAINVLMESGQFDDVRVEQGVVNGKLFLTFNVVERPILVDWKIVGPVKYSVHTLEDFVKVPKGRAIDRDALARSRYSIDSMYRHDGYYASNVTLEEVPVEGGVSAVFHVEEGGRVVIAQLQVTGNQRVRTEDIAANIATTPEGFLWFRNGKYDEHQLEYDVRQRLPDLYGKLGMIDFQVLRDSLIPAPGTGKAVLNLAVEEGPVYKVGTIDIQGNQHYSLDELSAFTPFGLPNQVGTGATVGGVFDQSAWEAATKSLTNMYLNHGYIFSTVRAEQVRRVTPDGQAMLDLRWHIDEQLPAHIHKINISGNTTTHDPVILEAITLIPGQLYSQDALLRSYQNIGNLGYFQQPMPEPKVDPLTDGSGGVDITFVVEEKRTGTVNFGATIGQGTGLGGFIGLEEPNLFGMGKRAKLSWNFGKNIEDFSLTYSDPAIRRTRLSGSLTVYKTQQKYVIGDLGQQRQEGSTLQFGLPFLGSRYSRLFASYGFQTIHYDGGSAEIQAQYQCSGCSRSTLGLSFIRETRVGLPFPTGGSLISVSAEHNGGFLGGTGNYRKIDVDTRWFTPLGKLGGAKTFGGGVQFTMGITAKSGFIFGNAGGFFTQLFSMGGVQYGIPLRGYDEFSITPSGYNPNNSGSQSSADAFGKSYFASTIEFGARVSQSLYFSAFFDAGNVYATPRQYDPTRLFRGAGIGAAMITPLGPIGVDLGYGFDKVDLLGRPAPSFQVHMRLGNIGN